MAMAIRDEDEQCSEVSTLLALLLCSLSPDKLSPSSLPVMTDRRIDSFDDPSDMSAE